MRRFLSLLTLAFLTATAAHAADGKVVSVAEGAAVVDMGADAKIKQGAKVKLNGKAGTVTAVDGTRLTIKAPNAKVPMVNEDSPLPERINYYLQTEINPGLANHGGQVSLVDIDEGIAILRFGGGCQGCGQADYTLKEGIEKTLLERIPELKGVRDVTDHSNKENAYY